MNVIDLSQSGYVQRRRRRFGTVGKKYAKAHDGRALCSTFGAFERCITVLLHRGSYFEIVPPAG